MSAAPEPSPTPAAGPAPSADLLLAHRLADAADAISSRYFEGDFEVETKSDGSPVTIADRTVEETIKSVLAVERPLDGVLGEEVGPSGPTDRRWILDGIDGTHNFAAGRSEWGTLITRQVDGEVVLGVITSPALGRRWWAERGGGSWTATLAPIGATPDGTSRLGPADRMRCTTADTLDGAVVAAIPSLQRFPDPADWHHQVCAALQRGDVFPSAFGHSAARVARGEVDATVHLYGGVWDHAVGVVLVEEAGGRFCDLWGGRRLDTATAIYTNAALFDQVMAAVGAALPPNLSPPPTPPS
ncbi:MAG: inositol monophosphatase family protein [Acidimicrobiales bacterium]